MVRKISALIVAALMLLSFTGCNGDKKQPDPSAGGSSSAAPSASGSENMERLCKPAVTGDFIQSWLCQGWGVSQWSEHLDMLKSAGIDKLIVQSTAEIKKNGNFDLVLYDSPSIRARSEGKSGLKIKADTLGSLLQAAQEKGVKIFVGLNAPAAWWEEDNMKNKEWYSEQAAIANEMAKEIYGQYKEKYPDALYGWYWWPEMYTQTLGLENYWVDMLNISLDYFTQLDPSMPMLFSPFVSGYYTSTPEQTKAEWTNFMKQAKFRKGDIFCPQDSVGASGISIETLEKQLAAQYEASKANENVVLWVNIENFQSSGDEDDDSLVAAPVERVKTQLDIASKYAQNIITFSYTHYYDPNTNDASYDTEYKAYLKTLKEQ